MDDGRLRCDVVVAAADSNAREHSRLSSAATLKVVRFAVAFP